MLRVDPFVYVWFAALLLILPLKWLLASFLAALLHELCHCLVLRLSGGQLYSIQVGIGGAVIEGSFTTYFTELLCAAAGPVGSLSLLFFCRWFPELSICGLAQGLFNLLPVYPLDGGRILLCILNLLLPSRAEKVCTALGYLFLFLLVILGIGATLGHSMGVIPLFFSIILVGKGILRKIPCKR